MEEERTQVNELRAQVEEVGIVIEKIIQDHDNPKPSAKKAKHSNPDIQYMTTKYGFEPKFIARALRSFGEPVVMESLRRWERGWQYKEDQARAVFWKICQAVKSA